MSQKEFPCSQCGAKLAFEPGARNLKCQYCNFENLIPQSEEDVVEQDFEAMLGQLEEQAPQQESQTVKCPACAAEVTLSPSVAADRCPFCDTGLVATGGSTRAIKPHAVLPFKFTRDEARKSFRDWVKSRWFAPNKLKTYAEMDNKMAGIYLPYWTYDSRTTSFYRGERGDAYYTTETYTVKENGKTVTKTRQVRHVRWTRVSGVIWRNFDDVLVLATAVLPTKYVEALEPWDLKAAEPYQDEFLSGFQAESYQVDLKQGFGKAQEIMDTKIRSDIRSDIGGDEQRIHSVNTKHEKVTFKHLLLPVWLCSYRLGEKVFRFMVNARTGEVQGERPWSAIKITLAVLAALAVIITVIVLLQGH
jgi:LSD1 subclass zinc finger protein